MRNAYLILGAHPELTDLELRALYRSLARQHHPDRPTGNAEAFMDVTWAYSQVETAKARAVYRSGLALLAPACAVCGSSGTHQRSVSFTKVERAPCEACGGCGYLLAAGVRSAAKRKPKKV